MKQPKSRVQALIEVAEAALGLEHSDSYQVMHRDILSLKRMAKKALAMPSGNPNIAEAAEKGRAALKERADLKARCNQVRIRNLRTEGVVTYRDLANRLNWDHVPAPSGGKWHAASVRAAELREL